MTLVFPAWPVAVSDLVAGGASAGMGGASAGMGGASAGVGGAYGV